jgi:hypothetical protein
VRGINGRIAVRRLMRFSLPGFTYGLDIVLLVGRLRLGQHQTVDEVHQALLERLAPLGVRISRREILYLFEAYCTVLRASSEVKADQDWLGQVKQNGGIIVSVDGIQPEKGNETISVVRDALTGRVLAAEQVTSSETAVMKALLSPVAALDVPVLGTITDAQESELQAVEQVWPEVPHQVCQFHAPRRRVAAGECAPIARSKRRCANGCSRRCAWCASSWPNRSPSLRQPKPSS